jgi:hypothetical protein
MRKTIVMAGVLALSASMAHAQGRDRDRDDDEDGWRDRREYRAERGRDYDEDHRSWHHGSGHKRGGGARFFLRSGETRLGVVCDTAESMRNCVDAAMTLFDKVRQGALGTSGATGGPSTPAPRP